MINFPSICLDNFYEDPDGVHNFAMDCIKNHPEETYGGNYPGQRSKQLHEIDKQFFDKFCGNIFSLFYDFSKTQVIWVVETSFQLIIPYSEDPLSIKNTGWIHVDGEVVMAGVIYLSPDADLQSGTSLYQCTTEKLLDKSDIKKRYFTTGDDTDYDLALQNHNSNFRETVRFNNVYNRMIAFDSDVFHGVNSFWNGGKPRLTQVFFVKSIESNSESPIVRCRNF
jgi:hypothetical protein